MAQFIPGHRIAADRCCHINRILRNCIIHRGPDFDLDFHRFTHIIACRGLGLYKIVSAGFQVFHPDLRNLILSGSFQHGCHLIADAVGFIGCSGFVSICRIVSILIQFELCSGQRLSCLIRFQKMHLRGKRLDHRMRIVLVLIRSIMLIGSLCVVI